MDLLIEELCLMLHSIPERGKREEWRKKCNLGKQILLPCGFDVFQRLVPEIGIVQGGVRAALG